MKTVQLQAVGWAFAGAVLILLALVLPVQLQTDAPPTPGCLAALAYLVVSNGLVLRGLQRRGSERFGAGQHRHGVAVDARRRDHGAGRRVVQRPHPGAPAGRPRRSGPRARRDRRLGGPPHGNGERTGRAVRHGGGCVPAARARPVRRREHGPLGARDRSAALPVRGHRMGCALVPPPPPVPVLAQGGDRRRPASRWRSPHPGCWPGWMRCSSRRRSCCSSNPSAATSCGWCADATRGTRGPAHSEAK